MTLKSIMDHLGRLKASVADSPRESLVRKITDIEEVAPVFCGLFYIDDTHVPRACAACRDLRNGVVEVVWSGKDPLLDPRDEHEDDRFQGMPSYDLDEDGGPQEGTSSVKRHYNFTGRHIGEFKGRGPAKVLRFKIPVPDPQEEKDPSHGTNG